MIATMALTKVETRTSSNEEIILQCLLVLQHRSDSGWCTSADISRNLLEDFGRRIHHNTVRAILNGKRASVARRKRNKMWWYRVLLGGDQIDGFCIRFMQPDSVVENVLTLHSILKKLKGCVKICDPYIDTSTLEHLCAVPSRCNIQLLGVKVDDKGCFRRVHEAMKAEGRSIEVRCTSRRTLHDRYIVDDRILLILGTSLNQL